ncbi:hypothetical protein TPHA_0H01600 [Tetrapisispora phaffii CBS 4417]|uniref:VWFA domain-containing protein n=1 Tax=Tetrapisispora phaffii (strain ATCC 24235 / CBS 4417 / NBRC 1672 / NRRL Y-8282 / UCD 70-5) TaxID=1071381 RepID=G8BX62_TETPH|nr:hypothetical protein TPHA_0H01600 [Tetrapisispora phaffii CBS 4417]CCE64366.1 hypothetical protein TPHA_0H01600 [Tetrapisispora phaffii CBS 4417]
MTMTTNTMGSAAATHNLGIRADHRRNKRQARALHQFPTAALNGINNQFSQSPVIGLDNSSIQSGMNTLSDFLSNGSSSGVTPNSATPVLMNDKMNSFTPKQFSATSFETPVSMLSPSKSQAPDSYNSPYVQLDFESLTIHDMSPIVPTQRWEDQLVYLTKSYGTNSSKIPPLPSTQFYCHEEDGNCDPRLLASSMCTIPAEESLREATKLPLGLTVQPFTRTIPTEEISVIKLNNSTVTPSILTENYEVGPLRCRRCRAYLNPHFQFTFDSAVICNICNVKMKLANEQVAPIDVDGKRSDYSIRPELFKGCVDFEVPSLYNAIPDKETLPLHYLFLIDVSTRSIENGGCISFIHSVKRSINYIRENQPNCKVAIMSYDKNIRFYELDPSFERCREYIVSEIDDCFIPFNSFFFASTIESQNIIETTLDQLASTIENHMDLHLSDNCYGSAINAAKLAFDTFLGGQGGKIIAQLGSQPTIGSGKVNTLNEKAGKTSLKPDLSFYKDLSKSFNKSFLSLDLYVTAQSFVHLANVGYPSIATSGVVKYYGMFTYERCNFILCKDILHNISIIKGYQAQLKIRASNGLSINKYFCESNNNSDEDPIIPVITSSTVVDVLLKYSDKLKKDTKLFIQAALLYTDINGVRKVRVINTSAPSSSSMTTIFKFVNQNVIMRLMIRQLLLKSHSLDFASMKKSILEDLSSVAAQYRALISGNSNKQFVTADTLMTLPTFMLGFQKSKVMKSTIQKTFNNDRISDYFKYFTMNQSELSYKLYPQIIPLHIPLAGGDLSFYDANYQLLRISVGSLENLTVRNSMSQIVNGGAYLIFNGEIVYLWFNENTNRSLLEDLLGVPATIPIEQIKLVENKLRKTGTRINKKVAETMRYWSQIVNKRYIPLVPLRPQIDSYYPNVIGSILIEDYSMSKMDSLNEFTASINNLSSTKIQNKQFIKTSGNEELDITHQKFVQF